MQPHSCNILQQFNFAATSQHCSFLPPISGPPNHILLQDPHATKSVSCLLYSGGPQQLPSNFSFLFVILCELNTSWYHQRPHLHKIVLVFCGFFCFLLILLDHSLFKSKWHVQLTCIIDGVLILLVIIQYVHATKSNWSPTTSSTFWS